MNSRFDSKINMLRTVAKLYARENSRFNVIPIFSTIMATYNTKLGSLEPWLLIALSDPKVDATIVEGLKKALADSAEKVAMHTGPYAAAVDNVELQNTMNVRASSLVKYKKDRLPTTCQDIHASATAVKVAAAPYGLTQADLDTLEDAIEAYEAAANTPRLSHGDVKTANEQIDKIIGEMDELLEKQLDRLVVTFSTSDPTLVSLWKTARTIVDMPSSHTSFTLTVKSAADEPIEGATCTLTKLTSEKTGSTNASGVLQFPTIPSGDWAVSVTAPGFVPYSLASYKVVLKAENMLEVKLDPA